MTTVAIGSDMAATARALLAIANDLDVDPVLIRVVSGSDDGLEFDVPAEVATAFADYEVAVGDDDTPLVAAGAFTVVSIPNGAGDGRWNALQMADDNTPAIVFKREDDDEPRIAVLDGTIFLGDGATPIFDAPSLTGNGEGGFLLAPATDGEGSTLTVTGPIEGDAGVRGTAILGTSVEASTRAGGVIVKAPDNSRHRILVGNDGTLSTEAVV